MHRDEQVPRVFDTVRGRTSSRHVFTRSVVYPDPVPLDLRGSVLFFKVRGGRHEFREVPYGGDWKDLKGRVQDGR